MSTLIRISCNLCTEILNRLILRAEYAKKTAALEKPKRQFERTKLLCENLLQLDEAGQTIFLGHAGLALD